MSNTCITKYVKRPTAPFSGAERAVKPTGIKERREPFQVSLFVTSFEDGEMKEETINVNL